MNNSFIAVENISLELEQVSEPKLNLVKLREKETELIKLIEAINKIGASSEWQYLRDNLFKGVVESLKRQRDSEVEKKPLNGPVIHSLNGQLAWAKKYLDIATLADIYKLELANIRKQLHGYKENN